MAVQLELWNEETLTYKITLQYKYIKNKRIRMKKVVMLAVIAVLMLGCGGKKLSPVEKKNMTTRTYKSSYDSTYAAVLAVFQDEEYQLKNTDKGSGLIVAQSNKSISETSRVMQNILIGKPMTEGSKTEVSTIVKKLKNGDSKVRITMQETTYSKRGGMFSSGTTENTKQIYNQKAYNALFGKIEKELNE